MQFAGSSRESQLRMNEESIYFIHTGSKTFRSKLQIHPRRKIKSIFFSRLMKIWQPTLQNQPAMLRTTKEEKPSNYQMLRPETRNEPQPITPRMPARLMIP